MLLLPSLVEDSSAVIGPAGQVRFSEAVPKVSGLVRLVPVVESRTLTGEETWIPVGVQAWATMADAAIPAETQATRRERCKIPGTAIIEFILVFFGLVNLGGTSAETFGSRRSAHQVSAFKALLGDIFVMHIGLGTVYIPTIAMAQQKISFRSLEAVSRQKS